MKVEREIAGLSLPFAAGTAFSAYSNISSYDLSQAIAMPSLLTVISLSGIIIHMSGKDSAERFLPMLTSLLGLFAGIFCGLTANITATHAEMFRSGAGASVIGERMREACGNLPFRSEETNAVITALLTGDRSGMPQHLTDTFRKSGASHILALSGLHLGIIYMLINKGLAFYGNSRTASLARSATTIVACGTYTFATGAGPSISRAMLFIILNEAAKMSGRHRSTGSTLMAALLIQLTLTPSAIRSVGFQLSYAAMAGIAFIFPFMKDLWPEKGPDGFMRNPVRWIWNSAALSISCQITTAPLAFIYFGSIPKHFLLTNLIALPVTGMLIPSAIAATVLNLAGICPAQVTAITEKLVEALTGSLEIIAGM